MSATSGAATPPSRLKTQANYKASNAQVIACANGIWPQILMAHGINESCLTGKHSPCAIHGGKDGFRFTDEGKGSWVCATCTEGKFKDGFNLIALHNGISNTEAFKRVAQYLNLNTTSPLQENNVKQPSNPIKELHNQEATKLEQDQKLLTRKKVAGAHADNILSMCIMRPHPYLQNKSINQSVLVNTRNYEIHYEKTNTRTGKVENKKQTVYAEALVIPIYDIDNHKQLIGAQFINPNGSRAYIAETPKTDGIHIIKGDDNLPYIGVCEGYKTGLSVNVVTSATVIIAFDANGLEHKAERLKAFYSGKQLVCMGDNDSDKQNIGNKAAQAGALKVNGFAIIPPVAGDWNDYHNAHGLDVTKAEITKQLEEQKAIKELEMSVVNDNVVDLTTKLKLSYDLIPRGEFPYLSSKNNPLNVPENIECLLDYYGIKVRFNLVSKRIEITIPDKKYSKTNEGEVKLSDIAALCVKNGVPKVDLPNWLLLIADKHRYSPAVEWINSKPWDGVSKINDFIKTVVADNHDLAKTLIYRWMLGAVAAAFSEDGVSLPGVLVFQGIQGVGKTAWFKSLVPTTHHSLIVDGVTLDPRSKDSVIGCTSHWLVELGELDGTFNKSDLAALKAFITKSTDYYRVPYARTESTASRNTAFFGSVNNTQYLVDETGNRRWWSISVKEINYNHSMDMQQVWAEFKSLLDKGESYYLTKEESKLLTAENELFETIDPMEEKILNRFRWDELERHQRLTACEVLEFIGFDLTKGDRKRLGKECGAILTKITGKKAKKSNGKMVFDLPRLKNENNFQDNHPYR
jgi:putative DNA primase/helicase